MKNVIRAIFGGLVICLIAIIVAPLLANAQVSPARLTIINQASNYSSTYNASTLITVTGNGPSLTSTPSGSGSLTYSSNFNYDSRVIVMNAGSYAVSVPTMNGYTPSYVNCTGYLAAGENRTCTITSNGYSTGGTSFVNVNVNVQNRYGGTRTASDFVISVSGINSSVSSIQGSTGSTQISLGAGSYSVNVSTTNGYSVSRSDGCFGTIGSGETRTCSITVSDAYTYNNGNYYTNPTNTLTCSPSNQTVVRGTTVSFTAVGGTGTYTWATADRTYLNVGPSLNVQLLSSGDQAAYVTSGYQTATCLVKVLPSGVVLGVDTKYPSLPNTGFGDSIFATLLALFAAFIVLPFAAMRLYPHAKRTVSALTR